jgi:hypothetical protein
MDSNVPEVQNLGVIVFAIHRFGHIRGRTFRYTAYRKVKRGHFTGNMIRILQDLSRGLNSLVRRRPMMADVQARVVFRHVGAAVHDGGRLFKATYAYRWNDITDRNAGYLGLNLGQANFVASLDDTF